MGTFKLYEVRDQIERLLATEVDEHGAIGANAESLLDKLEFEAEELSVQLGLYLKGELLEAEAVKKEADNLAKRAKGHAARAEWILSYLKKHTPKGVEYRKPGEFVTFLGYECHNMKHGDHNVYNLDPRAPIVEATIEQASRLWTRRGQGFANQIGFQETGQVGPVVTGMDRDMRDLIRPYVRMVA